MKLADVFRVFPGGTGLSSKTVTIKQTSDDSDIATATTDSGGLWTKTIDLNPAGRIHWTATDGTTTRRGTNQAYGMAGPLSLYEQVYVNQALGDGIVSGATGLDTFGVTATGTRQVSVASGAACIRGIPLVLSQAASPATAGSGNASGSTRIDTVVIEVTPPGQTEEGKAVLKIVEGTTSAPSLTQDDTLWQFPLCNLTLANGGSSYTVSTDRRAYLLTSGSVQRNPVVDGIARVTTTTPATIGATSLTDVPALNVSLSLVDGVPYDVQVRGFLTMQASAGQGVMALYIDGTSNASASMGTTGTGLESVPNVHTATVIGGGTAITCGLLAAKSGSGASVTSTTGLVVARAVPRA